MGVLVSALDQLLDVPPVDTAALGQGSLLQRLRALRALRPLLRAGTSGLLGALMAIGVCLHLGWVMQSCPLLGHRLARSPSWAVTLWKACPPWSFQTQPGTGSHLGTATQSHTTSASPGLTLGRQLPRYYEVLTAPISKVSAGSSSAEPPADLLPESVQQQPPTLSLVLCFSPGPDPGSVV